MSPAPHGGPMKRLYGKQAIEAARLFGEELPLWAVADARRSNLVQVSVEQARIIVDREGWDAVWGDVSQTQLKLLSWTRAFLSLNSRNETVGE